MSGLSTLKFTNSKPQQGANPQQARRQKLSIKLEEQIQLAKAQQSGTDFAPTKIHTVKDAETGKNRKVEVPKKLKPWWWTDDKGKLCITVRYGSKPIEIMQGKNTIEANTLAEVIASLQIIRTAVQAGELDAQLAVLRKSNTGETSANVSSEKRSTLRLPTK